jgi:hypothetical protein
LPGGQSGFKPRAGRKQKQQIMKSRNRLFLGIASAVALAASTYVAGAAETNKTFRTTGYFVGLTQGTNPVTGTPTYDNVSFAGHNLVNLAMGRSLTDTNFPRQVLATTFACDLSSASLVVYDLGTSNTLTIIASSVSVDAVYQQDATRVGGPNRAHFVAALQVNSNGNDTNGLAGGYFTVAGRIHLNPETGCPQPVLVVLDRDSLDKVVDDVELPASLDPDTVPLTVRTGLAHLIGVVDAVTFGESHTILVPYGGLSIRRELPAEPVVTPVAD